MKPRPTMAARALEIAQNNSVLNVKYHCRGAPTKYVGDDSPAEIVGLDGSIR